MPVPSLFKRKASDSKDGRKRKPKIRDDNEQAFGGDDELLALHAETAELLRLVKTPAKGKSPSRRSAAASASPAKRAARKTIEVLEEDEEEDEENADDETKAAAEAPSRPRSSNGLAASGDLFAFDAEEARVRKAADTFVPDTSPSKRAVAAQRSHLSGERQRLQAISRKEDAASERQAYETQNRLVVNRVESSAIKIQAHSRGFLARKHAEEDRRKKEEEAERERLRQEVVHWHEVRDVEKNEVWFYNALTGNSQWERPACLAASDSTGPSNASSCTTSQSLPELPTRQPTGSSFTTLPRVGSLSSSDLPPLSPSTSRPSSCNSATAGGSARLPLASAASMPILPRALANRSTLPALGSASYDYVASQSSPWECDSVAGSTSDQASLCSERLEDDEDDGTALDPHDFSRGRRATLPPQQSNDANDDWQTNDSLFLADGSKNSKLRDTIRYALQTSKFDSISSLVASNVVLRRKPTKGRHSQQSDDALSRPNQRSVPSPSRGREIVLGRKEAPMFVAVLDRATTGAASSPSPTARTKNKRPRATALPIGVDPTNPLRATPQIRDLVDPGLYEDLRGSGVTADNDQAARSPEKLAATTICFNCWSSSNGRHCEAHQDANDFRKVKSAESALMCANWHLDQLRRKYRAEEIQEIFMKQNASLRYDKTLKQYVTVIEARHPIYRLLEQLTTSWNKTMRRKLHTRAWFRSFIEQLRAGRVPKADASTPKLMKLKTTIQNNRWCSKYSDSVREFHPKAPTTVKNQAGDSNNPIMDVIMIDPAHPQLRNWILKTDSTKPLELYRPRKYELPPRRCVPMPTPSFLDEIPLPVPNIFIDCGHIASWFERLGARVSAAALTKALLQIQACSPPRGVTEARKTKHVTPVTVLFATFGRKPTPGMLAVGGLSAELLTHMLVTTYIPAQYGHFIVFERRAIAPLMTKDHDAVFACLEIDPKTMEYVFRPLEHALNVRRPPTIILAAKANDTEAEEAAVRRFPSNRPEQTGEENGHGFRTFWLVRAFEVPDDVDSVAVQPTADVLSPNSTSMNATITTKADRFYPFCIPTTKENTPIEFIHLLWIGQSSRNQPQTFTTLGAQQPGEFMKNSNPNGALGVCTSVIYRSWAYMQSSPYEEFTTDEGIAYWYDQQTGETFWSRPILPQERHRGKDGDVDGVVVHGQEEVATLGVGVDKARYSQLDLRKYMTKKLEAPEEKQKRLKQVSASAKQHELVVTLDSTNSHSKNASSATKSDFARIDVPKLEFKKKPTPVPPTAAASKATVPSPPQKMAREHAPVVTTGGVDINTKQLIDTITQALGSALPALAQTGGAGSVDMLQLGIGLGMGLGLRSSQQQAATALVPNTRRASFRSTQRGRPLSADSQVTFAEETEEGDEERDGFDGEDALLSTTRSDESSACDASSTSRSVLSVGTSVEASPSPDELELLPPTEREKLRAGYGEKTPGYRTHAPAGEGHTWANKPIDASAESQTAVDGFGGALHQRVACLPKGFVEAVSSTKTCKMQANYLPVIKNTNQPRSVGIVRPRPALDEWLAVGYSPWSAGRAIFGTQFIKNLMHRPEIIAAQKSGGNASVGSQPASSTPTAVAHVEKKENVTQAVKEAQQLETVFSLCRHGKYDELERMITSPDWTVSIDAKDVTGNTLLSIACQNNNKRIAKLCLRRGADINTQNLNGQTLLHYCHEYGFHDLMDYLLDKGARDDIVNADGLTCYEGLSKEAVDAI